MLEDTAVGPLLSLIRKCVVPCERRRAVLGAHRVVIREIFVNITVVNMSARGELSVQSLIHSLACLVMIYVVSESVNTMQQPNASSNRPELPVV